MRSIRFSASLGVDPGFGSATLGPSVMRALFDALFGRLQFLGDVGASGVGEQQRLQVHRGLVVVTAGQRALCEQVDHTRQ